MYSRQESDTSYEIWKQKPKSSLKRKLSGALFKYNTFPAYHSAQNNTRPVVRLSDFPVSHPVHDSLC